MPSSEDSRSSSSTVEITKNSTNPLIRYIAHGHGSSFPKRYLIGENTSTSSERASLLNHIPSIRYVPDPQATTKTNTILNSPPPTLSQSPLWLLLKDVRTFFVMVPYLPNIIIPTSAIADDGNVLSWETMRAKRDNLIIYVVSALQFLVLLLAPILLLILPGLVSLVLGGLMYGLMWLALWVVQGPRIVMTRDAEGLPKWGGKERWIFVNGVMTGYVDLQFAVDGLSQIFARPVMGIHNCTSGFVGDIFECLIQRVFSYATRDVRAAYDHIRSTLADPEVEKVVLIGHSQGGLILSLVVDKLLMEVPAEWLGKIEIYTFGSAASHFNNPLLKSSSTSSSSTRRSNSGKPPSSTSSSSTGSTIFPQRLPYPLTDYPSSTTLYGGTSNPPFRPPPVPARPSQNAYNPFLPTRQAGPPPRRAIPHIEHFANSMDPIPRWGVLHSVYELASPFYAGQVFVRLGGSGHFFSSHYLAAWFPLDGEERSVIGNQAVLFERGLVKRRNTTRSGTGGASGMGGGVDDSVELAGAGTPTAGNSGAAGGSVSGGSFHWGDEVVDKNATPDNLEWGSGSTANLKLLDAVSQRRASAGEGALSFVGKGGAVAVTVPEPGGNGASVSVSVRDLSRLWGYTDGKSPPALPLLR